MSELSALAANWKRIGPRFMPFADAATTELPLSRLIRLSLFQVSVGLALALLVGTLNRVMIVELAVPATLVGVMLALPLLFAPLRALIGFKSDTHRSALGWRRVPYIWFGSLLAFGGFAIMPFALLVLSGDTHGPVIYGQLAAALAFLLVGAGMHTTQTVGLALATDLAPDHARPKVVALMCTMLLVGAAAGSLAYGLLLTDFTQMRLIQVIQGTAVVTLALNGIALWKQEARDPARTAFDRIEPSFAESWRELRRDPLALRRLVALAIGTAGFALQDVLLEPYGGQVLGLSVSGTTFATALLAAFGIAGFVVAARAIGHGRDPYRTASYGALHGLFGLTCVMFTAPIQTVPLFVVGVALVGFGGGLFAHATLTAAMRVAPVGQIGLALGVWGAVQATASGGAMAASGLIRDGVNHIAMSGHLGSTLADAATGYGAVYALEIFLLFAALVALGPLVRGSVADVDGSPAVTAEPPRSLSPLNQEAVA
jgi:BCD family chlorophyll transporter-like MFS transporter